MKGILFVLISLLTVISCTAQFEPNYNEEQVPDFILPDVLTSLKGKKATKVKQWEKKVKPDIYRFFEENVYGRIPGDIKMTGADVVESTRDVLNGKAIRKQVELTFEKGDEELSFTILIYLPDSEEKVPVFIGYNFYGNHTVTKDVDVIISEAWCRNNESFGIRNNQLTEQSRGVRTHRWAIEKIIDSGMGLATIYYGEVDPDRNNFGDGIHPFLYKKDQDKPAMDEWGSIAAWSWGLSRAMDYFENDKDIDEDKTIVFGHSRLGKTSIWTGVRDERFAAVVSNNSGCGGAALSKRRFGETIWKINSSFPHWFCRNFRKYGKNEKSLPVDQHQLLALIAPRPVYVASAQGDRWADPKGEFLSAYHASRVYELYGKKGLEKETMPAVDQPVQNTVAYHIRTGKHDVTDYDWEQYIKWAKEQLDIK